MYETILPEEGVVVNQQGRTDVSGGLFALFFRPALTSFTLFPYNKTENRLDFRKRGDLMNKTGLYLVYFCVYSLP